MHARTRRADPARLRELAGVTLEAYRKLNEIAAEARFVANERAGDDDLARAADLLEEVLAEIRTATTKSKRSTDSKD